MKENKITFSSALAALALLALTFAYSDIFVYPLVTSKWVAFYLITLVALGSLFFRKEFCLPKLNSLNWAFLAALFMLIITVIYQRVPVGYEGLALDRLSFLGCIVFFYVSFAKQELGWADLYTPALLAIFGLSIFGLAQAIASGASGTMPYFSISGTMGHTNIAAQWVAGLLCLVVPFIPLQEGKSQRVVAWFVVLLSLAYIFVARARSVWLFLAVASVFLIWRYRSSLKKEAKKAFLLFSGVVATLFVIFLSYGGVEAFLRVKSSMFVYRATLWKATLKMIFDNPLGYGPDQFVFWHLPYIRESIIISYQTLARSPHNEFLRYLVEDGVIVAALIAIALGTILFKFFRNAGVLFHEKTVILLLLLFFGLEGFFQFPWQTAPTVFLFSILIGYMLVKGFSSVAVSADKFRPVLLLFFLLLSFFSFKVSYSYFNEKSSDYQALTRACDYFPANWTACFRKGSVEMNRSDWAMARSTFMRTIEIAPYNYLALRNLSAIVFQEGKTRDKMIEGCYYLWKHNFLFGKLSPIYEMQFKYCDKKVLDYLDRRRPDKFYGRQLQ